MANTAGATLDLNNFNTTLFSLAGGGGSGGNVSLGSAALTLAGNGSTSYSGVISGTGGSLSKTGLDTLFLFGTNTYTGATSVSAGAIGGAGTIAGAVTLSGTGGINLVNSSTGTMTLGSTLALTGAAGAHRLSFELGNASSTTDKVIVTSGAPNVTTNGAAVIGFNQIGQSSGGRVNAGTYTLIQAAAAPTLAKFTLATTAAFGSTFALGVSGNNLQVTTTRASAGPAAAFWTGAGGNAWSTAGNWNTDATSAVGTGAAPSYQSNVTFATTTPVATNLTTNTVDTDFDINSLTFADTAGGVTIGGTKMLTLEATNANGNTAGNGITASNTSGTNTIAANIGLASSQTWTVASGGNLTVSGAITDFGGALSLTKTGAGTLTLTGANTYLGNTTTNSLGTLLVSGTGSITSNGALSVGTSGGGGTFQYDSSATSHFGSMTIGNSGNNTGTLNQTAGTINVATGITMSPGINGASNYNLSGGTLAVTGSIAVGQRGNSAGTFNLSGTGNLTAGTLAVADFSAGAPSVGVFNQSGGTATVGSLVIAKTSTDVTTHTGTVTLSGGTLNTGSVSGGTALGGGTHTSTFNFAGGTLKATGSSTAFFTGLTTANVQDGGALFDSAGFDITGGQALLKFAGSTTDSLSKSGAGTLTLTGTNTYSGATTISAGTLQVGDGTTDGAISATSNVVNNAALTFNLVGTQTLGGAITGTGTLTKTGAGTLALSGANAYSGTTTISGGTLKLSGSGTLGATSASLGAIASGAVLDLNGTNQTIGFFSGTSAGQIQNNSGTGTSLLTVGGSTAGAFAGVLADNNGTATGGKVGLALTGTGKVTLGGSNTYSGGTTVGGTSILEMNGISTITGSAIATSVTGKGNVTLADGASITNTSSTSLWFLPTLTLEGTTTLLSSNRLGVTFQTLELGGGTRTVNINGIAKPVSGGNTLAGETTGLSQWELATTGALGTAVVQNGTLNLATTTATSTNFATFRINNPINFSNADLVIGSNVLLMAANTGVLGTSAATSPNVTVNGILNLTASMGSGRTVNLKSLSGTGSVFGSMTVANTNAMTLALNGTSGSTTFAGTLNDGPGTGALIVTKTGGSTQILTGASTYTGATTVSAGVLTVQNAAALGTTAAGTIVASGAALQLQGDISVGAEALTVSGTGVSNGGALRSVSGANTYAGLLTLGASTRINADAGTLTLSNAGTITGDGFNLTLGGSGDIVVNSVIGTGVGNLIKDGSGTVTLSAVNTFTGTTTISAGTLRLGVANALDSTSAIFLNDVAGAVLDLNGFSIALGSVSGGGTSGGAINLGAATLTVGDDNTSTTYSCNMTGSGGLTKVGTGVFTLSGSNDYTGATTVSGGTLRAASTNAFGDTSAVTLANTAGVVLDLNGSSLAIGSLSGGGALGGNVTLGVATLTTGANDSSTTFAGEISGSGGLTKTGAGTFTLTAAQAYTGLTTVNAGTLALDATASLFSGTDLTLGASGAATFANAGQTLGAVDNANTTVNALNFTAGTGTITLGSLSGLGNTRFGSDATVTGGIAAGTVTTVGLLTASLSGGTVGAGSLSATTLSGATTTVAGAATIGTQSSGTTTAGGVATLGTLSGGTANLNGSTSAITTLNGGTVNLGASSVLTVGSGSFAGVISGSGASLVKTGGGTLSLTAANTYTGTTTVTGGTLTLNASSGVALANTSAVVIGTGGTVALGAAHQLNAAANLTLNGGTLALHQFSQTLGTLDLDAASEIHLSGSAALVFANSSALDWNSALLSIVDFSPTTNSLRFGTSASGLTATQLGLFRFAEFGNSAAIIDADGFIAPLFTNYSNTGGTDLVVATPITGTTTVDQSGTGTTTLTAPASTPNTSTGDATVSAGTLVIGTAAGGNWAGNVTVSGSGILKGRGDIGGAVIVNAGGTYSPGNSPAIQNVATLTVNTGGLVVIELDGATAGNGDHFHDQVVSAGAVNLTGGTLTGATIFTGFTGYVPALGAGHTIITGSSITGTFADHTFATADNAAGLSFMPVYSATALTLFTVPRNYATALANLTANQTQVGNALESLRPEFVEQRGTPGATDVVFNRLIRLDAAGLLAAYNDLNPEKFSALSATSFQSASVMNGTLQQRSAELRRNGPAAVSLNGVARSAPVDDYAIEAVIEDGVHYQIAKAKPRKRIGYFASASGAFTDVEAASERNGYSARAGAASCGFDYALSDHHSVGLVVGQYYSDAAFAGDSGSAQTSTQRVGLFYDYHRDGFYINTSVSVGVSAYETQRKLGFLEETARGETDGLSVGGQVALGYDFKIGNYIMGPKASVSYDHARINGFAETGSAAGLSVGAQQADSVVTNLGVHISRPFTWKRIGWIPEASIGVSRHHYNANSIDARFGAGGAGFTVKPQAVGSEFVNPGVSLTAILTKGWSVRLSYDGIINNETADHRFNLNVGKEF